MKYLLDNERWYAALEIAVKSSEDAPVVLKKELTLMEKRKILKDVHGYAWTDLTAMKKEEVNALFEEKNK